ncbi:MAG: adenosylcobinamide-GDP ribazoletransferase [bacterium]|jgi:adenosylcobinamide-GDP ribazoletransferase
MRPLVTAIRTLTLLPIPGKDSANLASALPFFPAIGVLIGALVVLTLYVASLTGWIAGAGVIAMIVAVWITRGLHVDGLADVMDALGASRTRERRLEIMKDPHMGAFGVMAIVGDLLLKTVALSHLAALSQWSLALVPFIVSRTAQVFLATSLPYARQEGGKAAAFVQEARHYHLLLALLAAVVFCFAASGLAGLLLLLQGLIFALFLKFWMHRHFGGVTGDLLGASNEVIETGLLTFAAFIATAGYG